MFKKILNNIVNFIASDKNYLPDYMTMWIAVCKKYCEDNDVKLLWVNPSDCGLQYKSGAFRHAYVEEMYAHIFNLKDDDFNELQNTITDPEYLVADMYRYVMNLNIAI